MDNFMGMFLEWIKLGIDLIYLYNISNESVDIVKIVRVCKL